MIWNKNEISINDLNILSGNTLAEHLGMQFTEINDN